MEVSPKDATDKFFSWRRTPSHPQKSFLLLRYPERYDLPKGHIEQREDELTCALRELEEETGIKAHDIEIEPVFSFIDHYQTQYKRFPNEIIDKTLVVFLGWLQQEINLKIDGHISYVWILWNPPHNIQEKTIAVLNDM
ncbi:MAG TPA: NUDIX domain-containing protein [Nostocaceae cyanobacterium]|nr:NUDIX domain-containing protein [Nostocaceae cyanobacterium]